jgi:hypothetical protein
MQEREVQVYMAKLAEQAERVSRSGRSVIISG